MILSDEVGKVADRLLTEYEEEAIRETGNDPAYKGAANSKKKLLSNRTELYKHYAKQLEIQLLNRSNYDELLFRTIYKILDKELKDTLEDIKSRMAMKEPADVANLILIVKEGHEQFIKVFKLFESEVKG